MALQDSDLFIVQRNQQSYKMPASEITSYGNQDLQAVTDAGSDTTNGATFGGSVGVGTDAPVSTLSVVSGVSDQGAIDTNNQVQISRSGSATYAAYLSYGRLIGSNNYAFQISALNNNIPAGILLAPDGGDVTVGRDKIQLKSDGSAIATSGKFGNLTISGNTIEGSASVTIESGGTGALVFKTKNANSDYNFYTDDGAYQAKLRFGSLTSNRTYTFPDLGGTIALTSDVETYTAGDGLDLNGTEFAVDTTVVRTSGNQTVGGTKTFSNNVKFSKVVRYDGNAQVLNPASVNLNNGQFWTCVGGSITNPTGATASMSGLILFTGAPTSWGSNWKFPGGVAPDIPANSVVPYYIAANNVIHVGLPTPVGV